MSTDRPPSSSSTRASSPAGRTCSTCCARSSSRPSPTATARPRPRRPRHRLGRADRRRRARDLDLLHPARDHAQHRLVRAPRVRDAARPAPRLHPRPGRRAGHHRVRADDAATDGRGTARRPASSSSTRATSSRWSCSGPRRRRGVAGPPDPRCALTADPRRRRSPSYRQPAMRLQPDRAAPQTAARRTRARPAGPPARPPATAPLAPDVRDPERGRRADPLAAAPRATRSRRRGSRAGTAASRGRTSPTGRPGTGSSTPRIVGRPGCRG